MDTNVIGCFEIVKDVFSSSPRTTYGDIKCNNCVRRVAGSRSTTNKLITSSIREVKELFKSDNAFQSPTIVTPNTVPLDDNEEPGARITSLSNGQRYDEHNRQLQNQVNELKDILTQLLDDISV